VKSMSGHGFSRPSLALALFHFGLAGLASLAVPLLIAVLFDRVVPQAEAGLLPPVAAALLTAAMMRGFLNLAGFRELLRRGVETADRAGRSAWAGVASLPLAFLRRATASEIATEAEAAAEAARRRHEFLQSVLPAALVAAANFGLMIVLEPFTAWIAGGLAAAVTGGAVMFRRRGRAALFRHFEETGRRAARMAEAFRGFARIRLAGGEPAVLRRWQEDSERLNRLTARIGRTGAGAQAVLAGAFALCCALVFACSFRADLPVGRFLAFFSAFGAFAAALRVIAAAWPDRLDALTLEHHAARLRQSASGRPGRKLEGLAGNIGAGALCFRYAPASPRVLQDCSFEIRAGEFVAISGCSGSGKSTLLKLLLGFVDPEAGEIRIDGNRLRDLDPDSVRARTGLVTQDMVLFPGSLWKNIAGGGRLSLAEAWHAAERAGLAEEIRALPMQMHTLAGDEGRNFSSGERRRLVLARALARNPSILLLDEPAGGLDHRSKTRMWKTLGSLKMTRILFARNPLPAGADRYLTLEEGRIHSSRPRG
jgi:ABC-type bacteriocin/lantibiotic exporter with double-glycine peptidase domain